MHYYILIPAVFLIAACYSSVGLGGGTAYLSVISFFSGDPDLLRPTAWALNVIAGTIGVRNFHRAGHLRLREALPYVLGGIAGAIVGALLPIHPTAFRGLLGAALVVVALLMLLRRTPNTPAETTLVRRQRWAVPLVCGGQRGPGVGYDRNWRRYPSWSAHPYLQPRRGETNGSPDQLVHASLFRCGTGSSSCPGWSTERAFRPRLEWRRHCWCLSRLSFRSEEGIGNADPARLRSRRFRGRRETPGCRVEPLMNILLARRNDILSNRPTKSTAERARAGNRKVGSFGQ